MAEMLRKLSFQLQRWSILGLMLLCIQVFAAPDIQLDTSGRTLDLGQQISYFEDPCACLTLDEIARPAIAFVSPTPAQLAPRLTGSALWLRFSVRNASQQALTRWLVVLPAHMHEIALFTMKQGVWQREDAGVARPFSTRLLHLTEPAFELRFEPGERASYFLRLSGQTTVGFDAALWDPAEFRRVHEQHIFWLGVSAMMYPLLVVASLLVYAALRNSSFLYLAVASATHAFYMAFLHGYTHRYLWPEFPQLDMRSGHVFGIVAAISYAMFVRKQFELATTRPRLDSCLQVMAVAGAVAAFVSSLPGYLSIGAISLSLGSRVLVVLAAIAVGLNIPDLWRRRSIAQVILGGLVILQGISVGLRLALDEASLLYAPISHAPRQELFLRGAVLVSVLLALLVAWVRRERMRDLLVSYIGHDLRAPVANVLSAVRRVRQSTRGETAQTFSAIERSASHQLALIDDLVDLGRDKDVSAELTPAAIYLPGFVRDLASQADALAHQGDNAFTLRLESDLPALVRIDLRRLRQVLMNLLSNAAKFTQNGAISLTVAVDPGCGATRGCTLRFEVADTGRGIAPCDHSHVFEPFKRGRNSSNTLGSGLGLAIARRWVEALGGTIQFESWLNIGTRFIISLPVAMADEEEIWSAHQPMKRMDPVGSGLVALVVDDHRATREQLREMLLDADFDVLVAEEGNTACSLLRQNRIDLVITDQFMPGPSGWDVLLAARSARRREAVVMLYSSIPPCPPEHWDAAVTFDVHCLKPQGAREWIEVLGSLGIGARAPIA